MERGRSLFNLVLSMAVFQIIASVEGTDPVAGTVQSIWSNVCNQNTPLVDGLACTTVCGVTGGECYGGTCWCNCETAVGPGSILGQLLPPTLVTAAGPTNCVESTNATKNAECDTICHLAPPYTGKACSVIPVNGTGSSTTDICVCSCTSQTLFSIGTPLGSLCSLPAISSTICQPLCGPFGGHCSGGTCWCRCPPNFGSQPILDPSITGSVPIGCPSANVITNNPQLTSACRTQCDGGNLGGQLCSAIPSNPGIPILSLLPGYNTLVNQTTLCVCGGGQCDTANPIV